MGCIVKLHPYMVLSRLHCILFFGKKVSIKRFKSHQNYLFLVLLVLLHLFHINASLFVFTPFILKPHPNDPGRETGHFDQLFLHKGIRPGVSRVTSPQRMQLFLIEHRPHSRRFMLSLVYMASSPATGFRTCK